MAEQEPTTSACRADTAGDTQDAAANLDAAEADRREQERAASRARYRTNRERVLARQKAYRAANPEKIREQQRRHIQANRDKHRGDVRTRRLKKEFGLTEDAVAEMLQQQGSKCPICLSPFVDGKFHVDHDHATGKVRSLLCGRCNSGMGTFQDDPELIRRAIRYLKAHHNEGGARKGASHVA